MLISFIMSSALSYNFIKQLAALPFVDEIWLYGSRARGDNKERSDIDLAIIAPKATTHQWLKISDIVENADTLLKIDYVRFDQLKDSDKLKDNILNYKKILYQKETDKL